MLVVARAFDEAQRADMEAFRDFDAETFPAVHDPDAISIFHTGELFIGIDAIMARLGRHFRATRARYSKLAVTEFGGRIPTPDAFVSGRRVAA